MHAFWVIVGESGPPPGGRRNDEVGPYFSLHDAQMELGWRASRDVDAVPARYWIEERDDEGE